MGGRESGTDKRAASEGPFLSRSPDRQGEKREGEGGAGGAASSERDEAERGTRSLRSRLYRDEKHFAGRPAGRRAPGDMPLEPTLLTSSLARTTQSYVFTSSPPTAIPHLEQYLGNQSRITCM
jgi:hypothetical protein